MDAAEGCVKGSRAGGCCLSSSPASAEARSTQLAAAHSPQWGSGDLSDRGKFLMRTTSAFFKAALLTLAARDLVAPGRN